MADSKYDWQSAFRMTQDPQWASDARQRAAAAKAFAAYSGFASGAVALDSCLRDVTAAARLPQVAVSVGELLNLLAADHAAAREAVRELFRSGDREARFTAISVLRFPRTLTAEFVEEMLRAGLADRAVRVRMQAAHEVYQTVSKALLPEMLRMREGLSDPDDRYWADLYIDLTRDGSQVEACSPAETASMSDPDRLCRIAVRCEDEGGSTLIGGCVSRERLRREGAAEVARSFREQWLARGRRESTVDHDRGGPGQ